MWKLRDKPCRLLYTLLYGQTPVSSRYKWTRCGFSLTAVKSLQGQMDTCVRGWFSSCCQPWESYRSVWNGPTVGMFPGPWGVETNGQEVSSVQPVCIPNNTVNVLCNPPDKGSGWRREQQYCEALVCSSQTEAGYSSNNCRSLTNNYYVQWFSLHYLPSNDVKYKWRRHNLPFSLHHVFLHPNLQTQPGVFAERHWLLLRPRGCGSVQHVLTPTWARG